MEPQKKLNPLIAIVGETASGKSALAIDLAERFKGEIVCADSRTLYKGMDIGTAKPSQKDRNRVTHHLLDITTPNKPITVADYKDRALAVIQNIAIRNKLPIMVGGSGLYIDSVIFDYSFRPQVKVSEREHLNSLSVAELQKMLNDKNIPLPFNSMNKRHLVSYLENGGPSQVSFTLRPNTLLMGIKIEREQLKSIIQQRVDGMFSNGLIEEAMHLGKRYGWEIEPMRSIGYQEFSSFKDGDSVEDIKQLIVRNTLQYAKRQRTWFKRNKHIHWIEEQGKAVDLLTTFLNK